MKREQKAIEKLEDNTCQPLSLPMSVILSELTPDKRNSIFFFLVCLKKSKGPLQKNLPGSSNLRATAHLKKLD